MEGIVQCQCGAKVRRPPPGAAVAFRCPRCQTILSEPAAAAPASRLAPPPPLATVAPAYGGGAAAPWAAHAPAPPPPAAANSLPHAPATGAEVGAMCPTCQTTIRAGDPVVSCPDCRQVHHNDCWHEVGGCATYGCKQSPAVAKDDAAAAQQPLSAWGDNKACPACGEQIKSIAVKCRFCGTEFGTVDPLSARDLHSRIRKDDNLKKIRTSAVTLFIFSIIGLAAPLMAIIALAWVTPNRKALKQAGPVYLVLGYSSLGLSVLYSLMMLLFWLS